MKSLISSSDDVFFCMRCRKAFSLWEVDINTKRKGSLIEISFTCPHCNSRVRYIAKDLAEVLLRNPKLSLEEVMAIWLL